MKKITSATLLITAIVLFSSYSQSDYVQIKLVNPCSEKVTFSYSASPGGRESANLLYGYSKDTWSVKRGDYINYQPWKGTKYFTLGQVEYKDQVFTCGCK